MIVTADEKPWWKKYLRFGASIQDDFDNESTYTLAAAYRHVFMSRYQSYWETKATVGRNLGLATEFYQPLGVASPYFVAPKFEIGRDSLFLRQDNDIVAEYHRAAGEGVLRLGREVGNDGELYLGILRGRGRFSRSIGDPDLPEFSFDTGAAGGGITYDSLDQPDFPTSGARAQLEYWQTAENLGANENFGMMLGGGSSPVTFGDNTLLFSGNFVWSPNQVPVEYSSVLGGFLDLSGYSSDSVTASSMAVGRLIYYRKLAALGSSLFGGGIYGGASLELATIHNDLEALSSYPLITAGSAFLGVDTPIVPMYLAFGLNDESQQAIYLVLGRLPGSIER